MQYFELFTDFEDIDIAVLVSYIDLAVGDKGRTPYRSKGVVGPVVLSGLGVEAVDETAQVGCVEQAVADSYG